MHSEKLKMIMSLMEYLQEEMQPGKEDFAQRLGREEPKVEMEISTEGGPMIEDEMEMEEDPEESLKNRLMKMRE